LGKKRVQALKDLVKRVQQPDLSAVMNSIIQSDELGVSIAQLLKIQGDQLRMKRFQRAEKLANEAPVKMIFPIALFIVPAVMIIMGAPLVMQTMKALFK
jgi:tight adherence protein C